MNRQQGSALSETLIGLMVLLPAFMAMDYLGRLQEIRRDSIELTRAASWETSVRPVAHALTNPSISQIAGMDRTEDNPLWQRQGTSLIHDNRPPEIRRTQNPDGELLNKYRVGVKIFAHGQGVPDWAGALGLSGNMLDLPQETAPINTGEISARALLDPVEPEKPVTFTPTASLTPDSWVAHSDAEYQRRLEQVSYSGLVYYFTVPAHTALGFLPIFKEGRYAAATDFIPESRIHPNSRKTRR